MVSRPKSRAKNCARWLSALTVLIIVGCERSDEPAEPPPAPSSTREPPFEPKKVELVDTAMGTEAHFIAYTSEALGEDSVRGAMSAALAEIRRLEALMTSWRDDSEVGEINANAGKAVKVSPETFEVFEKSQWASRLSGGAFDVSFNVMGDVWKFGDAAEERPRLPDPKLVAARRSLIDYEKVELDEQAKTVRIGKGMSVSLGGIAKGYAIDRAAAVLRKRGVTSFLAQAGGDLYGAGRKPNGEPWVSGIQDPRGPRGLFFATIELVDHAFSTAGDYARFYVLDGKRYHHIIDPRTGYPATASRSVTVWADDALTADAIDDAVFIIGVEKGLALVESLPGVGAIIVDDDNRVHVSQRLAGKVRMHAPPSDGP